MKLATYLRLVWLSALYDLVVTAPFATPWTARATFATLDRVHAALGLPGAPLPAFAPMHLFFVTLFGTVVVMWSLVRLTGPQRVHGLVDGLGRMAFATWMGLALSHGASTLLVAFVIPEAAWGIAQLAGFARTARQAPAPALQPAHAHR